MKLFSSLPDDPVLRRRQLAIGGAVLILFLALLSYLVYREMRNSGSQPATSPTPTATPTSTPTASPTETASPTASATSGASPTASPTPVAATLPSTVKAVLADFFKDYAAKDTTALNSFFTPDTSPDIQDMRSILFTGKDTKGQYLGGPVLFQTNNVSEVAKSYSILSSSPKGSNWIVTVQENRVSTDNHQFTTTTEFTFVPGKSGQLAWMIDNYIHTNSSGKYNGFFTP